jgi:hypothetical protein
MRHVGAMPHHVAMTNAQTIQTSSASDTARPARRVRRRLLAAALGLGLAGATLGVSTSPGRVGGTTPRADVAIPGVRGNGGGGGLYGVSSSPGSALRKAGGHDPIFG